MVRSADLGLHADGGALPSSALARDLERFLGDPHDSGRALCFRRSLELDRQEAFPAAMCAELDAWGIRPYYVPSEHGGRLDDYDGALQLMRVVARRDLTVAVAHAKTYLGSVCAWVGSDPEQAAALGRRIVDGGVVALALTERGHGSDLLAGELTAVPEAGSFKLTGEKWPINNATRGDVVTVLAAVDRSRGARGFDLLLVDKRELRAGSFRCLPKVRLHGIRGADISGIGFDDAAVPRASLIGLPGSGFPTVLRALPLTRTLMASLSLGAGDTALRIATAFAVSHRVGGRRLVDHRHARRALATAYTDVLTAEAVGLAAARSLQGLTDEASVSGAVAKAFVPSSVDAVFARLAELIGAGGHLAEGHRYGLFQKLQRDHRIVGIFDGSTLVNLHSIVSQGALLARAYGRPSPSGGAANPVFDLRARLPALEPARLTIASRRGCTPLNDLGEAVARLDGRGLRELSALGARVRQVADGVHDALARQSSGLAGPKGAPASAFALAERYTLCYAAACCIELWLQNRASADAAAGLWHDGLWLRAALRRLLGRLGCGDAALCAEDDALVHALLGQTGDARLLSLFPLELEESGW